MMGNSVSDDIDVSVANVWRAWRLFRRGKKPSRDILAFEYNLEENILSIAIDLQNKSYKHGTYRTFIAQENKRREVSVAIVRDRVLHRLLYEYLVGVYDKTFCYDVWSCRKGKGLLACIERTQRLMWTYKNEYLVQMDVKKFFASIDHEILRVILIRKLQGTYTYELLSEVIESYTAIASKQASKHKGCLSVT